MKASSQPDSKAGDDQRQRDAQEHLRRSCAKIQGRFFQRLIEGRQTRLHDYRRRTAIEKVMCADA